MLLVASWCYSAARVGGRMSGLCYYDKRTDMKQKYLSHKIMTMYNSILSSAICLETCHCVVLRNATLNSSHWWLEITRLRSVFRSPQFGQRVLVVCLTSPGHMVLTLWNSSSPHVSTTFSSHNRHHSIQHLLSRTRPNILISCTLHFGLNYEINYQLDAIEYLFEFF